MKIIRLPLDVANKIAAGEVVERPASVVKELVENAIDAGASSIVVEITGGGLDLIRVVDDGYGMDKEDARLAFERHATSKISCAEELFHINTLGFRGEALPSIASVSKVSLTTREKGADAAWMVELEGGALIKEGPASMRTGTAVEVAELFYNTPARLKYLKSRNAEARRIEQVIEKLALANPATGIRLTIDGASFFMSPGDGEPLSAASAVLGRIAGEMSEGKASSPGIEAFVLIAGPKDAKRKRQDQFLIVNGRPVSSSSLYAAIDRGLEGVQKQLPYPPAIIWLEVDPSRVDVNVHPSKAEVRFADDSAVFSAVHRAILDAVASPDVIPSIEAGAFGGYAASITKEALDDVKTDAFGTAAGSVMHERYKGYLEAGTGRAVVNCWKLKEAASEYGKKMIIEQTARYAGATYEEQTRFDASGDEGKTFARIIGQFRNSYIIAEKDGTLLVIDQHVAHERILVDRFLGKLAAGELLSQNLLLPMTVELMPAEAAVLRDELEGLKALGFDAEPFGMRSVIIRAVPLIGGSEASAEELLLTALRDLAEEKRDTLDVGGRLRGAATEMACKGAVKAGMKLDPEQMADIVSTLFETSNPYRCPHGRPVILKVDLAGIERGVGRR